MKAALASLAVVAALASCKAEMVDVPSPSIKVEVEGGSGSGTKISNKLILTAAHVVKDKKEVKIKNEIGATATGRVIIVDERYDIAVIESIVDADVASIKCDVVKPGTRFSIYGHPMGMEFVYSWGRIASTPRDFGPWASVYVVDATIIMGDSGAAAYDNFGRVIGLVVGIRPAPMKVTEEVSVPSVTGFGFVVPSSEICKFLDSNGLTYNG